MTEQSALVDTWWLEVELRRNMYFQKLFSYVQILELGG